MRIDIAKHDASIWGYRNCAPIFTNIAHNTGEYLPSGKLAGNIACGTGTPHIPSNRVERHVLGWQVPPHGHSSIAPYFPN